MSAEHHFKEAERIINQLAKNRAIAAAAAESPCSSCAWRDGRYCRFPSIALPRINYKGKMEFSINKTTDETRADDCRGNLYSEASWWEQAKNIGKTALSKRITWYALNTIVLLYACSLLFKIFPHAPNYLLTLFGITLSGGVWFLIVMPTIVFCAALYGAIYEHFS